MNKEKVSEYKYGHANCGTAHEYLLPAIEKAMKEFSISPGRAFDLGCGNSSVAAWLATKGFALSGVDPSESGIQQANARHPDLDLRVGSAYDALSEQFGTFPFAISLEVVEHVYSPRKYASCLYDLLEPGGKAFVSTPYHGYLKNLALAVTGKMDAHFTALWDHGHIKFWSRLTLSRLLKEAGLQVLDIHRVGRIAPLAKTMLAIVERPRS